MKFNLQNLNLHFEKYSVENALEGDLFLLHGFTGSCRDWEFLIPSLVKTYGVYTLDLIGHGRSDSPAAQEYYTMNSVVSQIDAFISQVIKNKPVLLGYSLGGRIALSFAAAFSDNISALILESSTWGIQSTRQRKQRIKEDSKIAHMILSSAMEDFSEFWMNRPIFHTQKNLHPDVLEKIKNDKINNNPVGLSNSLLASGTGSMRPLHQFIKDIKIPVLLITGALDKKFTGINSEMAAEFVNAEHVVVPEAGHNVHLEKPGIFTNVIKDFLKMVKFL